MFSFFKKLFKLLIKFVLKYWFVILVLAIVFAPILAPALSSLAASLPAWISWLPSAIAALGSFGWVACLITGIGLAYIVFPDETVELIESVAEKAGELLGTVVGAAAGGVASGLGLDGAMPWIIGGVAAYFLLTKDKSDKKSKTGSRDSGPRGNRGSRTRSIDSDGRRTA